MTTSAEAHQAELVVVLAAILDPLAYDDRVEQHTLGQIWDRKIRRLTAEQHASRAIEAGWRPTPPRTERTTS
ncbi:hypothetical protein [Pseudonocardia sp. NPDC049635]|uniref:hypothetical protein n=1 Tax=Pseudonocardia sp. NPDC049635 TaxID=3155506 RepID=UPI00340AD33B